MQYADTRSGREWVRAGLGNPGWEGWMGVVCFMYMVGGWDEGFHDE